MKRAREEREREIRTQRYATHWRNRSLLTHTHKHITVQQQCQQTKEDEDTHKDTDTHKDIHRHTQIHGQIHITGATTAPADGGG